MTYTQSNTDTTQTDLNIDEILEANRGSVRGTIAKAAPDILKNYIAVNLYVVFDGIPSSIIGTSAESAFLKQSAELVENELHAAVGKTRTSILFHDWRHSNESTCRLTYTFYAMGR